MVKEKVVEIEDRPRKNNNSISRIPEEGKQCNCTEQIHEVTSRLHHINHCYGKEPLMKAKLVNWKRHEKQDMSNLKVSLHNMFINYGGNTSNFTVEKPCRCHLNQVSKASITVTGHMNIMYALVGSTEKHTPAIPCCC